MREVWLTYNRGKFTFKEMCQGIEQFVLKNKPGECQYEICVGADSQKHTDGTRFVTAIYIHRIGHGAQYYYLSETVQHINSLQQKIMMEASLVKHYIGEVEDAMADIILEYDIKVIPDIDIGTNGLTKQFIGTIKSMFPNVRIKPYSNAASSVANKHSK